MGKLNRIGNLCIAAAVALLLVFCSCPGAWAAPDLSRKCSVVFTMSYNGLPLSGGSLKLFRIAKWTQNGGVYSFAWVPELADAGMDLQDYASETFARRIFMLVESRSLPAVEKPVLLDGTAAFPELDSGLYVVYQTAARDGFEPINAFCVSLPMEVDGEYVYDVQAAPKPRPEKTTSPHDPPDETTTTQPPDVTSPTLPPETTKSNLPPIETTPQTPSTPGERLTTSRSTPDPTEPYTSPAVTTTAAYDELPTDKLPQTGQLWWPAWTFGAIGAVLLGVGITLRVMFRRDTEDPEL